MIKCFKKILTANYEIEGYKIDYSGNLGKLTVTFSFYFFVCFKKIFRVDHDI